MKLKLQYWAKTEYMAKKTEQSPTPTPPLHTHFAVQME